MANMGGEGTRMLFAHLRSKANCRPLSGFCATSTTIIMNANRNMSPLSASQFRLLKKSSSSVADAPAGTLTRSCTGNMGISSLPSK
jgi:hypothetical protein